MSEARSRRPLVTVTALMFALPVALPLGCKSSSFSAQASKIPMSAAAPGALGYPTESCKNLGYVVSRGNGGWSNAERANEFALSDLREQAAERGANLLHQDSQPVAGATPGSPFGTMGATAYFCDPARKQAGPVTAAPTSTIGLSATPKFSPLPEGAGGFRLGSAVDDAARLCTKSSLFFAKTTDGGECSGAPIPLPDPSKAILRSCGATICAIEIQVTVVPADLATKYDQYQSALRAKFGTPKEAAAEIPADCKADLAACVNAGKAPAGAVWKWPDGHLAKVELAKTIKAPTVRVTYASADFGKRDAVGPSH